MNSPGEDPQRLLTEEGQWTEPWGASEDKTHCDKCDGLGRVQHTCWSCALTEPNQSCPACGARVRWEGTCPVCHGSGETNGKPRHGVSVFPTLEGLYHYMIESEADVEKCMVVELQAEAEPAPELDFDADQGAMLVIPRSVRGCDRVDRELMDRVRLGGS
jgi:DnaJ-class molecular chaperone